MPNKVGAGAALGGGLGGVRESRLRAQRERLAELKDSMQQVADRLRSDNPPSKSQRTALRARFFDLQRKVNELDGIVAGEGQEAQATGRVSSAPAAPSAGAPGTSGDAAAAAPAADDGVDVVA